MEIKKVGKTCHPAMIAIYALAYAGTEDYYNLEIKPDSEKLRNTCDWLTTMLKPAPGGFSVWYYNFDSTYNDVTIKAPWFSAFGQAVGIEALCAGYEQLKEQKYLDAAKQAAQALLTPLDKGGLLFTRDGHYFFEEIPSSTENPSHILNGHMRAMLALNKLYTLTKEAAYLEAFQSGAASLKRLLPLYDTGYALRYDLNPKKEELLFRFNDPYNLLLPPLPIAAIRLYDPESKKEVRLDVGAGQDATGKLRIAGNDWGQAVEKEKSFRPLLERENLPNPLTAADFGMDAPGTYFYLHLPSDWADNTRATPLELIVEYQDICQGNMVVEMRSMAPGPAFRPLRDGDLLLTGNGEWREWRVPLRPSDLGFWCGELYAEKHLLYLDALSLLEPDFAPWAEKARGYFNLAANQKTENYVTPQKQILPTQTPVLPYLDTDDAGVIMQGYPDENSRFINGLWDPDSSKGVLRYQPFLIAQQALGYDFVKMLNMYVKPDDAYPWFQKHAVIKNGAAIWNFEFDNAYNDIVTKAPWTSSFSHIYILKALKKALDEKKKLPGVSLPELYNQALNALQLPLAEGGFVSGSGYGIFLEEVPNATHVLNAHLATAAELAKHPQAEAVRAETLNTLRNTLFLFDAGYWLRYDQNPKKEFLLQIDWLSGERSPLFASFTLEDPQHEAAVRLTPDNELAENAWVGISGAEWELEGDFWAFSNGYAKHPNPLPGGSRHNAYLKLALPVWAVSEWFDFPELVLRVRYKDVAAGRFALKTQAIHNGNELQFIHLRNGVLECVGDGQWKEAAFRVRPQDLGWFVGPDYQKYVVEQLESLGQNDWFFRQYAQRHKFFLNRHLLNTAAKPGNFQPVPLKKSLNSATEAARTPITVKAVASGETYPGFGVENALDGNPDNDYTAFYEQSRQSFTAELNPAVKNLGGTLTFLDAANYASVWKVEALNENKQVCAASQQTADATRKQEFLLFSEQPIRYLRFSFTEFAGQQRLLLRELQVFSLPEDWEKNTLELLYSVGAELNCEYIRLDFSNCPYIPQTIHAWSTDSAGKRKYQDIFRLTASRESKLIIPVDKSFAFIRLDASSFRKNPQAPDSPTVYPEISFNLDAAQLTRFKGDRQLQEKALLSAADPANPLRIIRSPITEFCRELASHLLGGENLTDFEKIMVFMEHITGFKVGVPSSGRPDAVLLERIGSCGSYSNALLALTTTCGLEGRLLSLANYPENSGHAVTEIFVDGKWRVFDPTYGLYFKDAASGEIMSFEELRNPANKAVPVYLNQERYAFSGERTGWGTQAVYLHANPAGVIGPDRPMFYPLKFDLNGRTSLEPPDLGWQGSAYIGAAMINNNWEWTLSGLIQGREYEFILLPSSIGGDLGADEFEFKCRILEDGEKQGKSLDFKVNRAELNPIKISFTASAPEMRLEFTHPYRGPEFHYLTIRRFELKQIKS